MPRTSVRMGAALFLVCAVSVSASCSLRPADLPSPKAGIGDGYDITLEFANAMNLPNNADVMMNGLRVGEVRGVRLGQHSVDVSVRIASGTEVPTDADAVLRQNTLLGDTYIMVDATAAVDSTMLADGDTVPVTRTTSPPQLEDTMAVLANFVNGGSIRKVEDTVAGLNRVLPDIAEVQRLASTVSVDLNDLAENTEQLDRTLDGIDATAVSIDDRSAELSTMFDPSAMHYWKRINENVLAYVGTLLPSIGTIFEGGMWLVPMLDSLATSVATVRSTGEDVSADAQKLSAFLDRTVVPFLRSPSVDVKSISTSDGTDLTADVEQILRMLGAVK